MPCAPTAHLSDSDEVSLLFVFLNAVRAVSDVVLVCGPALHSVGISSLLLFVLCFVCFAEAAASEL